MTLNEKQIQDIADKHGISRTEVEELIKTNDFTENRDFTDDGAIFNDAMLSELVWAWEQFNKAKPSTDKKRRALRLANEVTNYLKKELAKAGKKSDFTDDANTPVTDKLYSLMTGILYILDRQMNRIHAELPKMSDKERDRLYNHPFIKEFKIDLLP